MIWLYKTKNWIIAHKNWLVLVGLFILSYVLGRRSNQNYLEMANLAKDQYKKENEELERLQKAKQTRDKRAEEKAKIAKATLREGVPMIKAGGSIKDWYSSFKTAGNGFSGMVNSPTMFMAGEAGAEHISISPHGSKSSGGAVININIAKIERDVDFNQLKPMIQRWILEANSRRGMI